MTDKIKRYPLDKLYYAKVDSKDSIICETMINRCIKYKQLITLNSYEIVDEFVIDFNIKESLKEEIKRKKINGYLINLDGKDKKELTIDEIIKITQLIELLENKSFNRLNDMCKNIVNQISDLLGINVLSNPSSDLVIREIEEIVIPASKTLKFKELLFNYIKISMIVDGNITITNDDYRIKRALKGCKIRKPEFENKFIISANDNGEITLDCDNVEEVKVYSKQKTNKKYLTNI